MESPRNPINTSNTTDAPAATPPPPKAKKVAAQQVLSSPLLPRLAVGPPPGNETHYVHDAESLKTQRSLLKRRGFNPSQPDCAHGGDEGYKMVVENRWRVSGPGQDGLDVKLFCGIYTHSGNHKTRLQSVVDTWGKDCDGFMAASDVTDESVGAVRIPHRGVESWNNMWQKVRSAWAYIHDQYADEYDWFYMGGDDCFVVVENMKRLLLSRAVRQAAGGARGGGTEPMYMGRPFRQWGGG